MKRQLALIVWALAAACLISAVGSGSPGSLKSRAEASGPFPGPVAMDYALDQSSSENSSIHLDSQNNISGAPVSLSVGSGYYLSHPIEYGSGMGSRTQMINKDSATSMSHDVDYAHGIEGETEFGVSSSRNSRDGPGYAEYDGSASIHMMIDENVTDGKINIGVLQGGDGTGPAASARKAPSLEMEEEYVGTYHIHKNMTVTSPHSLMRLGDGWLKCCSGGYFDVLGQDHLPVISADDVFGYDSLAARD